MYDLATIHRLNDAAALREQFPDHICEDDESVAAMIDDMYVRKDDAELILAERDALAKVLQGIANLVLVWPRSLASIDKYDALDIERAIKDNTLGTL